MAAFIILGPDFSFLGFFVVLLFIVLLPALLGFGLSLVASTSTPSARPWALIVITAFVASLATAWVFPAGSGLSETLLFIAALFIPAVVGAYFGWRLRRRTG